jgi:outer membrane protein OmpA-like peptidoglycan-associated protein
MASANEIAFTCDYQLGAETAAKREKIGSVTIAIDLTNNTARIDFGKGWFRTNTLQIDGSKVKETAPSTSGKNLGLFYFDIRKNSGGYSGDGLDEFFGDCIQTSIARSAANPSREAGLSAMNADRKQATKPAPANEKAVSSHSSEKAIVESDGRTRSPANPALAAEAASNPPSKEAESRTADTSAIVNEPIPPQTGKKATTEYYGYTVPQANPAWTAEATINPGYETKTTPPAEASATTNEPKPPRTGEKAITEYYGETPSPEHHASAAGAPIKVEQNKVPPAATETPTEVAATSPPPAPSIESCREALGASARAANLYFANSSSAIEPRSKSDLRKIAKAINDCGNVTVEVAGYTDDWGNAAYNKALSQLRANAVVDFLVAEGVAPLKLNAVGYGQEQPIATNRTAEGRRLNRRVEFRVSGPGR